MSLINQMLRDLDERQASALERGGIAAQVRALPREKRFPWASMLPVAVGGTVGVVGIWLAVSASSPPIYHTATVASSPSPITAAMAMPMLAVPMPVEPRATEEPVAEPRVGEPAGSSAADTLQMDFDLSRLPSRSKPAAPVAVVAAPAPAPAVATTPIPDGRPAQIEKHPRSGPTETADSEYRKALASYRQGRPNEAAEGFQAALRLDGRHVSARQALLSLLLEQRRWQEAQAVATEGLALLPAQPGWAMILARLQVEQGQVEQSERTMATYAAHGAQSADYLAFHGLLLERLQRPQEARAEFARARDLGNLPPELAAAIEQRLR
ncbi:MAG: tetratricopeptide repeat protein [Gammaproteobacteria bacterium]|nr:tetratricopeptide repeat protein [Gammaproteobacteria bacterium]MBU1416511.1 tetratricopeptide repeat protein [Gammaproteobacteria bacterium]